MEIKISVEKMFSYSFQQQLFVLFLILPCIFSLPFPIFFIIVTSSLTHVIKMTSAYRSTCILNSSVRCKLFHVAAVGTCIQGVVFLSGSNHDIPSTYITEHVLVCCCISFHFPRHSFFYIIFLTVYIYIYFLSKK